MAQISPAQPVVQGLVVVIALVVAQQIGRMLQLDHAGGVLSVASLATVVLMAAGLGLGISARWQLKPVYWLLVVGLCMLITKETLENPGLLRDNGSVIACQDWGNGRQTARLLGLRAHHRQEADETGEVSL